MNTPWQTIGATIKSPNGATGIITGFDSRWSSSVGMWLRIIKVEFADKTYSLTSNQMIGYGWRAEYTNQEVGA